WTYLTSPSYSFGRNLVNASVVSYMWLSASKTGKSTTPFAMATSAAAITSGAGGSPRPVFNIDVNIIPWSRPGNHPGPGARRTAAGRRTVGREMQSMATYVLVHGGGTGGWCYQRVA